MEIDATCANDNTVDNSKYASSLTHQISESSFSH